jgi:hypothetical protein
VRRAGRVVSVWLTDVVALGALNAAKALGVEVPGRVSVFGFDDIAMAGWELFALTTVCQDLAAMAGAAARLLLERIADATVPLDDPDTWNDELSMAAPWGLRRGHRLGLARGHPARDRARESRCAHCAGG